MTVNTDHYYRLASNLEQERISAASALIQELQCSKNKQKDFRYVLDRLIKGLASSRDSARIGFSMCLAEILSILIKDFPVDEFPYSTDRFLTELNSKLDMEITAKHKGKNLRSYLFGKLFGLQSLINSNVLLDEIENNNFDNTLKIFDQLIELSVTKSWMREITFVTIFKSLKVLKLNENKVIMIHLLSEISSNNLLLSTEGLLIFLAIPPSLRNNFSVESSLSSEHWKNNDPLTKGNLPLLSKVLEDSTPVSASDEDSLSSGQKGSWNPQLHFVWKPLLNELLNPHQEIDSVHKSKKHKKSKKEQKDIVQHLNISSFWPTCIDNTFFKPTSSAERKFTGFKILQLFLSIPSLPPSLIPILISPNLSRSLINHSSKSDRLLHTLSRQSLNNLVLSVKEYPDRRIPILQALVSSSLFFDKLTKTKTIRDLLSNCNSKVEFEFVIDWLSDLQLQEKLIDGKEAEIKTNDLYNFILDSCLTVIRGNKLIIGKISNDDKGSCIIIISKILEFCIKFAFLKPTIKSLDSKFYKLSKERLYSIMSDLVDVTKNRINWSGVIINLLKLHETELKDSFSGELGDLKNSSELILDELSKDKDENGIKNSLQMMFSMSLLELYSGDSESCGIIIDLQNIYKDYQNNNEKNTVIILDMLIDLILNYITQKSGLMKKLSIGIWDCIMDDVDIKQLNRLFEVLLTKENKQGQEKLFNQAIDDGGIEDDEGEEDDKDDEEDDSEEDDDDADMEEEDYNDEDDIEKGSQNEDESKKDKDTIEKIKKVEQSTTTALAKALKVTDSTSDNNSCSDSGSADDTDSDSDMSEVSDAESMSDEQMLAIDSTLSTIFKQRQDALHDISKQTGNQRKLEAKDSRNLMALFKSRVIDLLDIFSNRKPHDKLNIDILLCLLDAMALTLDKTIGDKSHKLIKKISKSPIEILKDNTEIEQMLETLKSVQCKAKTSKFNAHSQACNQICIFIVKSLSHSIGYEETINKIITLYAECLQEWSLNKADRITTSLFTDLIGWINSKKTSL